MNHILKRKLTAVLATAVIICGLPFAALAKSKGKDFTKGELKNDKYVNEYFGYSIGVPKGYTFYGDKELAEVNEVSETFIKDEEATKNSVDAGANIIVAYAEGSDGYSNLNIGVSKGDSSISKIDDVKEIYEESMNEVRKALESVGFTVEKTEVRDEKIDGEKTYSLWMKSGIEGIDMYQRQTMIFTDDYIMTITATTIDEDKTDAMFKEIKKLL